MPAVSQNLQLTAEAYLTQELTSKVKHELIDGYAYAMAGASENHARISGNIYRKFGNYLENLPCEPFVSDMKLKTPTGNFYYPDVMVVCEDDKENVYYKNKPTIIVEVLSRSTRRIDETLKLMSYINLPSLQEYVIIEQDCVDIEVFRQSNDWRSSHYFLGDEVTFESIGLTLSVAEIYHRVDNEDMLEFLNNNQLLAQT